MKMLSILAVSVILMPGCAARLRGHGDAGWERLGTRTVNFHADHDTILAGLQGTFRAIRIEVDRSELEMFDIKVHFGNGEVFDAGTRIHFHEGTWSRVIDLPRTERIIKRIDFWYKTQHRGEGRAVVTVWGLN